jgi:hypothetical protein
MPDPCFKDVSDIDNYFFDRYLHTQTRIFFLLGIVVPPILIPLNMINGQNDGGAKGLDRLSFSNVSPSHAHRYWAHLVIAIFIIVSVCEIIRHELQEYTRVQDSLSIPGVRIPRSSSLLLISKAKQQLSIESVRRKFHNIAGGVYMVRINRDYSELHTKLRQRDQLVRILETAETDLIIKANTSRWKEDRVDDNYSTAQWTKYLDRKDRHLTRLPLFPWLPSLPFIGQQVDTIYHFRAELARYNLDIEKDQQDPSKFPQTNSVFLYFHQRITSDLTNLAIRTRTPHSWTLKYGIAPEDTIWRNVTISWWEQRIRAAMAYLLITLLILGFALPVTFIGSLSQVKYLDNTVSWLQWIKFLPIWLIGAIQGVLPPLLLAAVTAIVPAAMRLLANLQGLHSRQAIENHVQIYYFIFLFVQGFLTISLSASITTIIGELSNTIQTVPVVLAQNLPKASNYFFSYIILCTCTTIVSVLTQVGSLVSIVIISPQVDKTARQKWMRGQTVGLQRWGTFVPVFTNIGCIGVFALNVLSIVVLI